MTSSVSRGLLTLWLNRQTETRQTVRISLIRVQEINNNDLFIGQSALCWGAGQKEGNNKLSNV